MSENKKYPKRPLTILMTVENIAIIIAVLFIIASPLFLMLKGAFGFIMFSSVACIAFIALYALLAIVEDRMMRSDEDDEDEEAGSDDAPKEDTTDYSETIVL